MTFGLFARLCITLRGPPLILKPGVMETKRYSQSSPVHPLSDFRGGPPSVTEKCEVRTEILVSNIGFIVEEHIPKIPNSEEIFFRQFLLFFNILQPIRIATYQLLGQKKYLLL